MAINVKKYTITITCEVCRRKITVSAPDSVGFFAALKSAWEGNWACPAGHAQPSIINQKNRRRKNVIKNEDLYCLRGAIAA